MELRTTCELFEFVVGNEALLMKHLIICPEYPPAPIPSGGIGTYVMHISKILAEAGEIVHVIAILWSGASVKREELCGGRLIIHRVPRYSTGEGTRESMALAQSNFPNQCFSWNASLLAENLVLKSGIDVIEAQEYAAPLYYFQLRRALGLGPKRQPPCIIHLHSPTEFIARFNEQNLAHPYFMTAKRLEDFSIAAADAWLCPSLFLARQAEQHYGLKKNTISVIRLPTGDTPILQRTSDVWSDGSICYIGRLEPRKGVIEWVDAAVAVADEFTSVQFEFIGQDLQYVNGISVLEYVTERIPARMKNRFHFRGALSRDEMIRSVGKARIAAVPSRWENFPNTCVEAMCSGIPVIASRNGGMSEMIEDGRTGWLADECSGSALSKALRRALCTSSENLASMGYEASREIRRLCDNETVLSRHMEFRYRIAQGRAARSISIPHNLPWAGRPLSDESCNRFSKTESKNGIAIVVTHQKNAMLIKDFLSMIREQIVAPFAVVLVVSPLLNDDSRESLQEIRNEGWIVREVPNGYSSAQLKNEGISTVFSLGLNPLAFVFIDTADYLYPHFTEACESVLRHCPDLGLVSSWTQHYPPNEKFVVKPCPSFPYQLLSNELAPVTAVRTKALVETEFFNEELSPGFENWDLFNVIMAAGWKAVTYPSVLSKRLIVNGPAVAPAVSPEQERMRQKMFVKLQDVAARDSIQLAFMLQSNLQQFQLEPALKLKKFHSNNQHGRVRQNELALKAIRHPILAMRYMLPLVWKAVRHPILAIKFIHLHVNKSSEHLITALIKKAYDE